MLLVAPAVDVEVNAAGAAAAVVIAVAFHLQVALPAACCLPPSACCYWLCPPVMQEGIERRIHQAQLTDSLALSWNLHSDFSTYYVPWRLLLVALCANAK